jgi:hypothetical protein
MYSPVKLMMFEVSVGAYPTGWDVTQCLHVCDTIVEIADNSCMTGDPFLLEATKALTTVESTVELNYCHPEGYRTTTCVI